MNRLRFMVLLSCISSVFSHCDSDSLRVDDLGIKAWSISDGSEDTEKIEGHILEFEVTKAYVILQTERITKHTIYYLTKENLAGETEQKMIECVARIWYQLQMLHMISSHSSTEIEIYISRETLTYPTRKFLDTFQFVQHNEQLNNAKRNRMYAMTEKSGFQEIIQVRPHYTKLDKTNIYLIECNTKNYVYMIILRGKQNNEQFAHHFSGFLVSYMSGRGIQIIRDPQSALYLINEKVLDGEEEYNDYIFTLINGKYLDYEIPVDNTPEEGRIDMFLYKLNENLQVEKNVIRRKDDGYYEDDVLNLEVCCIMIKHEVKEKFIYIGKLANFVLVNSILKIGEDNYEDYKMLIVHENNIHPAFGIMFEKYKNFYLKQSQA